MGGKIYSMCEQDTASGSKSDDKKYVYSESYKIPLLPRSWWLPHHEGPSVNHAHKNMYFIDISHQNTDFDVRCRNNGRRAAKGQKRLQRVRIIHIQRVINA